ncbi:MAG: zinc-dependent metalloprotease [Actinomycetota bacterium]
MSESFGDIPLFRELQKLLTSSSGPVNLELARQVAGAIAAEGGPEPAPNAAAESAFSDDVRNAEFYLSGYTRLPLDEPALSMLVTRMTWVRETLASWGWLFERLAARFTAAFDEGEGGPGPAPAQMLGQVVPLLSGIQVGTLVGQLSREAIGRYDLPIPRDDDGRLFIVRRNAEAVADEYGLQPDDLTKWIALKEVGLNLILNGAPWTTKYLRSSLSELIDSVEFDMADMERRLVEWQSEGVENVRPDAMIPLVQTERHRAAHTNLRSFVTVLEGYASHAAAQVGTEMVPSWSRIDEAMTRRSATPSEGKTVLSSLLGLSVDRAQVAAGRTFCAAVIDRAGISTLNKVWDAPDNLPSEAEIKDPFAWMERVAEE